MQDWGVAALERAAEGLRAETVVHICYGYGIEANNNWKATLGEEWRQYEQSFPLLVRDPNRDFTAARPNQKWVTDVTEFRVGDRKLYLSPVMDLFDRQIIAYRTGTTPNLNLTNESLRDAFRSAPGSSPVVHSDQGMHYRHQSWRTILAQHGAVQSMSRKGNCYDNAVMENFFGQLKTEMFHHSRFATINDLAAAIDEYVAWYNTVRASTRLEGMSPVNYRAHALAA